VCLCVCFDILSLYNLAITYSFFYYVFRPYVSARPCTVFHVRITCLFVFARICTKDAIYLNALRAVSKSLFFEQMNCVVSRITTPLRCALCATVIDCCERLRDYVLQIPIVITSFLQRFAVRSHHHNQQVYLEQSIQRHKSRQTKHARQCCRIWLYTKVIFQSNSVWKKKTLLVAVLINNYKVHSSLIFKSHIAQSAFGGARLELRRVAVADAAPAPLVLSAAPRGARPRALRRCNITTSY